MHVPGVLLYIRLDISEDKGKGVLFIHDTMHRWAGGVQRTLCFHSGSEVAYTSTKTNNKVVRLMYLLI